MTHSFILLCSSENNNVHWKEKKVNGFFCQRPKKQKKAFRSSSLIPTSLLQLLLHFFTSSLLINYHIGLVTAAMPTKANSKSGVTASSNESIKVFVRVRPPISNEVTLENAVTTTSTTSIKLSSDRHNLTCSYHRVFSDLTTQEEVFEEVKPLLSDVLAGFNGCIFAYGQTSAGKTHTMLGPNGGTNLNVPKDHWGILPRSAEFLFAKLEELAAGGNFRYSAKASFLQIYKEKLYDLLRGSTSFDEESGAEADLKIREVPRLQDPVTGARYRKEDNRPAEVFITGEN